MRRPHRPSPALVVAVIALVVALGGTGYAATKLPKNSVDSRAIERGAVGTSEVRNGSLRARDFAAETLLRGPQGPKGAIGATGAKGSPGAAGKDGDTHVLGWAFVDRDGHVTQSNGLTDSNVIHRSRTTVERPDPPTDPDGTTGHGTYCFVRLPFQDRIKNVQATPVFYDLEKDAEGLGFAVANLSDPDDLCDAPAGSEGSYPGPGPVVAMFTYGCQMTDEPCTPDKTEIIAGDKPFLVTFYG